MWVFLSSSYLEFVEPLGCLKSANLERLKPLFFRYSVCLFLSFSFSHIHILPCSLSHWLSFLVSLMLSHGCSVFLTSHLLTYSLFSLSHHSPFYPKGGFQGLSSPSSGKERNNPREPSSHPWPLVPSSLPHLHFLRLFPHSACRS